MPSQTMNHGFPPSSYFSEDPHFSGEKQVGFWKMDTIRDHYGLPVNGMSGAACSMPVASSPVEKLKSLQSQATRCLEVPDNCLVQDQKVNISLQRHAIGTERAVGHSLNLWSTGDLVSGMRSDLSVQSAWDKNGTLSAHYENGLFSSSLSELFSKKLRLSLNNAVYGHSVDTVASHYEEEEPFESLEEIESQTIGNLLPDDDDLLSGVVDGLEHVVRPSTEDEIEDLDLFSSIGGMDLGDYNSTSGQRNPDFSVGLCNGQLGGSNVAIAGEHPYGEHPSRTLLVRNIDSNLEDSELWALFERYGDIHTLYTTCKHRGFVILSYYDIRAARDAMAALQNKLLRRMRLDIRYSIPKGNPSAKDANQGTLAVFNVDSSVSHAGLLQIFGAYGEIKEIRETPHRSTQKLVEFYDTRAAEAALHALNQSEIAGKQIKLELVCPGGARLSSMQQHPIELDRDEPGLYVEQSSAGSFSHRPSSTIVECETSLSNQDHIQAPRVLLLENPLHHGISSSIPNGLPSLLRRESVCPQPGLPESGSSLSQTKNGFHLVPSHLHPHSLPEYHDGLANGVPCISSGNMPSSLRTLPCGRVENAHLGRIRANGNSSGMCNALGSPSNGSSPLPGNHYMWSNSNHPQPSALMWKNSPSFANGFRTPHPSVEFHGLPRSPSHMMNSALPMRNHHVGSAPTLYPSLLDRRNTYPGGSPEASGFHQGPIGSIRLSGSPLHHMEFASHNIISHVGANCVDLPVSSMNVSLHSHYQSGMVYPSRSQMNYMASSFESSGERARSRRSESGSMQTDNKKQYELDIDRIVSGEDNRTTLMIKNIPNKYTSKMLMAAIDEQHRGTYDFIYLPIDFKNKCNVGYAFINMTDPRHIVPFYKTFNGKKWEKFNSEKVASLAFARIQGKAALIAHFQNSSLMNEDKRCRPILFHSDGPNAGDQVPFPMGVNIRYRSGKPRSDTNEDNHQGSPPDFVSKEESSDGDSSSRSGKESELCHFQPHAIV